MGFSTAHRPTALEIRPCSRMRLAARSIWTESVGISLPITGSCLRGWPAGQVQKTRRGPVCSSPNNSHHRTSLSSSANKIKDGVQGHRIHSHLLIGAGALHRHFLDPQQLQTADSKVKVVRGTVYTSRSFKDATGSDTEQV